MKHLETKMDFATQLSGWKLEGASSDFSDPYIESEKRPQNYRHKAAIRHTDYAQEQPLAAFGTILVDLQRFRYIAL